MHALRILKNHIATRFEVNFEADYNNFFCEVFAKFAAYLPRAFAIAGSDISAISSSIG
jgi:hypothetical protein